MSSSTPRFRDDILTLANAATRLNLVLGKPKGFHELVNMNGIVSFIANIWITHSNNDSFFMNDFLSDAR